MSLFRNNNSKMVPKRRERLRMVELDIERGDVNQTALAKKYGVSQPQISHDFKKIREKWLKEDSEWAKGNRAKRVRQQESIGRVAAREFELSKRSITTCQDCEGKGYIKRKGVCQLCEGEGVIVAFDAPGDPNYLRIMKSCLEECARLENLHPPRTRVKKEVSHNHAHLHLNGNGFADASEDDLIEAKVLFDKMQGNGQNGARVIEGKVENE